MTHNVQPRSWSGIAPSPVMLEALAALERADLRSFRVGYASTPKGPFFARGTIEGLWRRGLIDMVHQGQSRVGVNRAGRAALAKARAGS